jgi:2-polyprenyl-6-methoxyphenol hydroxylase-like FAD-dependent oxidoreductase
MAMAGPDLLAAELQRAGNDYQAALTSYESRLAPEIRRRQAEAVTMARFFVPESWSAIWITNWVLKATRLPGISPLLFRVIGARSFIQ